MSEEERVDDAAAELIDRMRDLADSMRLFKQGRASDGSGLPAGMLSLLTHIGELADRCHGRELAARTGLDPSTVSRSVTSLVALGLVERRADPADGRASVLGLTASGRAALADAYRSYGEVLHRAVADWTAREVAMLCTTLGRFSRDLHRALASHDMQQAAR